MFQATATDDDYLLPHEYMDPKQEYLPINIEEFIEEYEYSKDRYNDSKSDDDRMFWDVYCQALEKIAGDVLIET